MLHPFINLYTICILKFKIISQPFYSELYIACLIQFNETYNLELIVMADFYL